MTSSQSEMEAMQLSGSDVSSNNEAKLARDATQMLKMDLLSKLRCRSIYSATVTERAATLPRWQSSVPASQEITLIMARAFLERIIKRVLIGGIKALPAVSSTGESPISCGYGGLGKSLCFLAKSFFIQNYIFIS